MENLTLSFPETQSEFDSDLLGLVSKAVACRWLEILTQFQNWELSHSMSWASLDKNF